MTSAPRSVQLYSVRDALAHDLGGTLRALAAIGFTNVEPYGFVDRADEYAAALGEAGLVAPSAHAGLVSAPDPAAVFAAAQKLGVTTVVDPAIPAERWTTRSDVVASATRLGELAAQAADFGLTVGYHNHQWEFEPTVDGAVAFEVFTDALAPEVVLEIDTFWSTVGGADTPALLRSLGDRVTLLHIKDGPLSLDDDLQLPAGQGALDVPAILAAAPTALRVIEFDGYVGDPLEGISASFAWLDDHDR
ncbi:xylose isomerase [Frondihabitans sp. PAMC 28766]|uniref:sugar phosphate isomerase/epimerase family protein n=1 Tax=Frondihabitans sp. PAMC 28766 TaxID=1795630 RepID=UPI00078DDFCF|nr:sugar phosphate isomerase/epimerase [Frondihabitans sp. PAMC 28766]AMM18909.1 xylose isomerase [Frondihabitans sp. PAMC 28766]